MAQRFQCALKCTYATALYPGRWFSRFLVEWLTQVVGWSLVDKSVAGTSHWDNVAASGATGESVTATQIELDSPGYAFSAADEGGFLTVTGFANPFEQRDGVYKIRRYLGAVGTVYTLELYTDFSVHTDGIPVGHTNLNWRLWFGSNSYCPSNTADWAVIGGKGTTGASLTNGTDTGGGSFAYAAPIVTFTTTPSGSAAFVSSDVGKKITIVGATTPGNNGTFVITAVLSSTQIQYSNAGGAAEAFAGTWNTTYDYHVLIEAERYSGFPRISISPFADWNTVGHAWTNPAKYHTTTLQPADYENHNTGLVYAEADLDHFTVNYREVDGGDYRIWYLYSVAELNAFYPETDPRPVFMWVGYETNAYYDYATPVIGCSANANLYFNATLRGLAWDDATTLTYYPCFSHVAPSYDLNYIWGWRRKLSMRNRTFYKIPLILESRTAGSMELRGTMRNMWACSSGIPTCTPLAANGEYISILRGMLIPWGGSNNAHCDTGYQPGVG